jgi:hypothetical protein
MYIVHSWDTGYSLVEAFVSTSDTFFAIFGPRSEIAIAELDSVVEIMYSSYGFLVEDLKFTSVVELELELLRDVSCFGSEE